MKSLLIIMSIMVSGCAGFADFSNELAGLGVVSQDKSTFENSTIIEVSPNWLYNSDEGNSWGKRVKMGARWNSANPQSVDLVLAYNSDTYGADGAYLGINSLEVKIDGEIHQLETVGNTLHTNGSYNSISGTTYTESKNAVVIPYVLLKKMVTAEQCLLRVNTSKGYEDSIFSTERIPGGSSTAILSIRKFIAKVDSFEG